MKISVEVDYTPDKLVALLDQNKGILYLRGKGNLGSNNTITLGNGGTEAKLNGSATLEEIQKYSNHREIYAGETVTIKF